MPFGKGYKTLADNPAKKRKMSKKEAEEKAKQAEEKAKQAEEQKKHKFSARTGKIHIEEQKRRRQEIMKELGI